MKISIRIFDFFIAIILLVLFLIPAIIIAIFIKIDSEGPFFYKQLRTGYLEKDFFIYKFRTMKINSDNNNAITIGNDSRITKIGKILRKTKLDEIPQLVNILKGEMSFVGFRPDTPEYTKYYKLNNPNYFKMIPGITGKASIYLSNEEELMQSVENPKEFYINEIIPKKVELNKYHTENNNLKSNIYIMIETIIKVIRN
ncbi:MAG: sugar transferase [Fusobacterium gastrosuis]|uniref:sugar transferase n=1 Tax=Fusobacterium gastrosuis TaxID=1755100 RepID=UPI002A861EF1|nr:sugar transferase [Fusobacterium gastrosuis]